VNTQATGGAADDRDERSDEIAHGALRGAVAAMAMSGIRVVTVDLGLVRETPPREIARRRARGLLRHVPRNRRRSAVELAHWAYGAGGGAVFAMLPATVRRRAWAGPVYGLAAWAGFQFGLAPALGLVHARRPNPTESLALALDHLVYGLVLSELRSRPRE